MIGAACQAVFYGLDYERQFQDVLKGALDAAVTSSTWLLQHHADALPLLRVHAQRRPAYEGEAFPFPASSDLVPQSSLAASPAVPWALKRRVAEALQALDRAHPAARAAGVSTFTVPAGTAGIRTLMEGLSLITATRTGPVCISQWTSDDLLSRYLMLIDSSALCGHPSR